ncbi:MAG: branched-chain amino acid ABC transporter substrate-binding protein [Chloroflexota bacterium]
MKKTIHWMAVTGFLLAACGGGIGYECTDPLGCVVVESGAPIKIAIALTLTGPDSPYGIDALRGVEIAIADRGNRLLSREIELVRADERCEEQGGLEAATALVADPQIVGVIGTTCSNAAVPAAKIISEAGMVLISPASTAPSLTSAEGHQAGFLRTIYNDKSQGQAVAEFAYEALGVRTMVTLHDGTPYSMELQQAACESFEQLGGECLAQVEIESGEDPELDLVRIASLEPQALYYPLYTTDGVAVTKLASRLMTDVALISSDGLLSADFVSQVRNPAQGMYLSGPALLEIDPSFLVKYKTVYGEAPIAVYHAAAYDAVNLLFSAIEKVVTRNGSTLYIPRQALRDALFETRNLPGLGGTLTCSTLGDCAEPNIVIYQVRGEIFTPIYP